MITTYLVFTYIGKIKEKVIKLIHFTGIPEESSSEGRGFQADQPTDFDELLARTQATAGKNARALQFDENSSATSSNQFPMSTIILSCYSALFVLRL